MAGANRDFLDSLHGALASELMKRIEEGTATASDLAVAAKLLRDNGVFLLGKHPTDILDGMKDHLPYPETADDIRNLDQTQH